MGRVYEFIIAGTVVAFFWIYLQFADLPHGVATVFSMFAVAIIPTVYFQIKNTKELSKYGFFERLRWILDLCFCTGFTVGVALLLYELFRAVLIYFDYNIPTFLD